MDVWDIVHGKKTQVKDMPPGSISEGVIDSVDTTTKTVKFILPTYSPTLEFGPSPYMPSAIQAPPQKGDRCLIAWTTQGIYNSWVVSWASTAMPLRVFGEITVIGDTLTVDVDGNTLTGVRYIDNGVTLAVGDQVLIEDINGILVVIGRLNTPPVVVVNNTHVTYFTLGDGPVEQITYEHRFMVRQTMELVGVTARTSFGGEPTGASIVIDVLKDGTSTTLWASNPGNRPTILAGANHSTGEAAPDTILLPAGSFVRIAAAQIGSTLPGSFVIVGIRWRWPTTDNGKVMWMTLADNTPVQEVIPFRFRLWAGAINLLGLSGAVGLSDPPLGGNVVLDLVTSDPPVSTFPTNPANRPTIVAGATESVGEAVPDTTTVPANTSMRGRIVSLPGGGGGANPGKYISMQLRWNWAGGTDLGNIAMFYLGRGPLIVGVYDLEFWQPAADVEILGVGLTADFNNIPAGQDVIADLVSGSGAGVSLWASSPGTRPIIPDGFGASSAEAIPPSPIVTAGTVIRPAILQRGTSVVGSGVLMMMRWQWVV